MKKFFQLFILALTLVALAACGTSKTDSKAGSAEATISKYETSAVAFMALQNGDVEVVVTDDVVAKEYEKNNPKNNVIAVGDSNNFEAEFYGLMFPKDSPLKAEFDYALKTILENGKYAEIYEKWFEVQPDVAFLLEQVGNVEAATASQNKKLLVGTDAAFAPFEFMDKGEIVGFDVDLLAAIMDVLGYEYELNSIGWEPLFASLQSKQIDLAVSGITITDDRKKTYDFSIPYFASTHMMVFLEGTDIKDANDLHGKRIGVQLGTTGEIAAQKIVGADK